MRCQPMYGEHSLCVVCMVLWGNGARIARGVVPRQTGRTQLLGGGGFFSLQTIIGIFLFSAMSRLSLSLSLVQVDGRN